MHIEQINPAECPYTFRGKNIARNGQRNMRELAKHVGVRSDGSRDEVFERIVAYLDENDAKAEIFKPAETEVIPEPAKPKRPAKKVARKRRRGAKFLDEIIPEPKKATFL